MTTTLAQIGQDDLDRVTGGAASTSNTTTTTARCGDANSQLLTTLQGLQSSLSNLGSNNNNGGLNSTTMLFLALAMSQRHGEVGYSGGGCRGGYYYRYW